MVNLIIIVSHPNVFHNKTHIVLSTEDGRSETIVCASELISRKVVEGIITICKLVGVNFRMNP